jgi:hypothetical protein
MAIGDAVATGRLLALPDASSRAALARASAAMQAFADGLDPAAAGLPSIAIVLVEAHLWGRTAAGPQGPRFTPHVAGPYVGDVIVVTGEPALDALVAGRITWEAAVASGIVVVDGPRDARERLATMLASGRR